ncbi:ER membrane protein complex subunit 7 [Rhodnius prolixus]|uniref:ER membrane protein complex subunit 7 n=1 Tax=Rhodnius prolixus TaxID=13249 RepID=UPI003D189FD3
MTVLLYFLINLSYFIPHITGNVDNADVNSRDVQYAYIVGKVYPPDEQFGNSWQQETYVHLAGGLQKGFIREDGSFVFTNVPPGSYIVSVTNPRYIYEPVRVEINSKGKIRARKVNHIQTSQIIQLPYPLKMRPISQTRYFQVREQWRIIDFLFNPMVLMMVLPLLLVMVLPRMMNDPEARKEMKQIQNFTNYDMPEMSEMITSFFGGGNQPKPRSSKQTKKKTS